jgi:aspartyl-tRNA(Asn)/glutamyl-tRNA(Gln) amidotransferase subunit A
MTSIAGHDPGDPHLASTAPSSAPDLAAAGSRTRSAGLRVGVPREYFARGSTPRWRAACARRGRHGWRGQGATRVPISLPHTEHALAAYYLIAPAEAASNLARFDGVRYGPAVEDAELRARTARTRHAGFGREVQRRIMLGNFVLSAGYYEAYYGRAQRVRTLVRQDFERAFTQVDVLATPTSPVPAFPLGARPAIRWPCTWPTHARWPPTSPVSPPCRRPRASRPAVCPWACS